MAKIIGVRFKNTTKIYYFAPTKNNEDYKEGSGVIVETAKGQEFATVVFGVKEVDDSTLHHPLKPIIRKATEKDLKCVEENNKKIPETLEFANEKIRERNLDMKIIGCEYSFDGKKLTFHFSAEGRVDFRELLKDLGSRFHTRIELHQVGIRDETKLLGGIAPCGRECCCASYLNDFGKVSVKMAKVQGLHLNPSKISGLCGRLMCCLEYENDYYSDIYKTMPKVGGTVTTPEGDGVVISNDMLKLISKVKISKPDGSEVYKDFPTAELKFNKPKCQDCKKNGGQKSTDLDDEDEELQDLKV